MPRPLTTASGSLASSGRTVLGSTGPAVVALGGGHGLAASLRALRRMTGRITAVVGVADNGGSSGRLRTELDVVPPGDLRMALAALCGDDTWGRTWARVMQHRFEGEGPLSGHALGNLLIAALWQETDDLVVGLDYVGQLLGAQGRVLPAALEPLEIVAEVSMGDEFGEDRIEVVRGQVEVATTTGEVRRVWLVPDQPTACPDALAELGAADYLVLGPGSWYTSVLPHLMIADLREALAKSPGRRVLVLNLDEQPGETEGFRPETHLQVWADEFSDVPLEHVIADERLVADKPALRAACEAVGATLHLERVAAVDPVTGGPVGEHDPDLLAAAFSRILRHGSISAWR